MAKLKHIALTTQDPAKTAAFYKEAFGMREKAYAFASGEINIL